MIRTLAIAGSIAWLAAIYALAVIYGLAGWRRARWAGLWWLKDIRSKRLLGAHRLPGAWVYVHWFGPFPLYVGQTVNMPARMRSEGHEIMALPFTHCTAIQCAPDELDTVERFLIRALPTSRVFNRTRGNT